MAPALVSSRSRSMPGAVSSLAQGAISSRGPVAEPVPLAGERDRKIGLARRDVRLQELVVDVAAVGGVAERQLALEVLWHDDRRLALHGRPAVDGEVPHQVGKPLQRAELLLRAPLAVGQAEVELEDVVPVGILAAETVKVGVVPCDPSSRAGEQCGVEDLPVVRGGVRLRGEVGRDAELLQNDRLVEAGRELARQGGGEELSELVVLHRVGVRSDEVDERRERTKRVPVVFARRLDAPGAVPEGDGLCRSRRPHGLDHDPRPGGDLLDRPAAAVQRHLVRDEPTGDRGMIPEAPRDLGGEPRLLRDHPDVAIEITTVAPDRIPVLPRHVPDDEGRDRSQSDLHVGGEEITEPV